MFSAGKMSVFPAPKYAVTVWSGQSSGVGVGFGVLDVPELLELVVDKYVFELELEPSFHVLEKEEGRLLGVELDASVEGKEEGWLRAGEDQGNGDD
jgi:hypothetical protein